MKIVQINVNCGVGSTGKICMAISELLTQNGVENYIFYSEGHSPAVQGMLFSNSMYSKVQALKSRILGNWGFNSQAATRKMISHLERIGPEIVHLHNLHAHSCDLEMLFDYFRKKGTKVFWTFHDCWAFTGYCVHFTMAGCDKWKTGCGNCPQRKTYSWLFDRSAELYERKKRMTEGVDLTIVTPSQWLADLVKQSMYGAYPVKVIHNGINPGIFRPTPSDFRTRHGLQDKYIVLGVAAGWGRRKGLDVFLRLAEELGPDYQVILVGTNEQVDKQLPENILSIHKTQNQKELAALYTAADIFANPTREDNYPTVNMEAIACGTPVVTYRTGGSPESIDETCGSVVDCDDVEAMKLEIIRICTQKPYSDETCIRHSHTFDEQKKYWEYLNLYNVKE